MITIISIISILGRKFGTNQQRIKAIVICLIFDCAIVLPYFL